MTISESADGAKIRRQAGALGAVVHDRLRHFVDDVAACGRPHQAGDADALAAFDQNFGQREGDHQRAVELGFRRRAARRKPSTASGRARARPCARPPIPARAHRDGRRAPSAASRRGCAGSPETKRRNCQKFSPVPARRRPCKPWITVAAMRRASSIRRGMTGGERAALPLGTPDRLDLPVRVPAPRRPFDHPMRAFELADDVADGLAVGARGEGQRHAVLEHRLGERDARRRSTARAGRRAARGRAPPASAPGWRAGRGPRRSCLPMSAPSVARTRRAHQRRGSPRRRFRRPAGGAPAAARRSARRRSSPLSACVSSAPVVSNRMRRSASRSG